MRKWMTAAALLLCALLASGCKTSAVEQVTADGSTSMEKVIGILGEAFENDTGIALTYNPTGSSAGISAVDEGRCEIGLSSRALKAEEAQLGLVGTVLAYDGIAILVHPENPVQNLTIDQIAAIYTGEIKNWAELGGVDSEIVRIGREAGSGTRDGFESVTDTEDRCMYRQELTSTGDVIAAVAQNPAAVGYASVASVKDGVQVVSVDGVFPDENSIRDGSYAIQRPFVLVTKEAAPLSEAAQKFMDFAFSEEAKPYLSAAGVVAAKE